MIKHVVLASHGTMAQGVYSAASIILGEQQLQNTEFINCYVEDTQNVAEEIRRIAQHCDEESVVFTDLFGGSVNNQFFQHMQEKGYLLISGMNLPLVIDALLFQGTRAEYEAHMKQQQDSYIQIQHPCLSAVDEEF